MLSRIEIENFYSIRDVQVIDLRAADHAPDTPERLAPLWKNSNNRGPKVIALFGPNASGKSNVLRAISFVAWFVRDSFTWAPDARLPFERFNDSESLEAPTRLAVHFAGPDDIEKLEDPGAAECRYAYEVQIGGAGQHRITKEELSYWPSHTSRKVRLFTRTDEGKIIASKKFNLKGYKQALNNVLRPNASTIATLAQLRHPISTQIRKAASNILTNILLEKSDYREDHIVQLYANNPKLVEDFNREIQRVDFGIRALEMHSGSNGPIALFRHEGLARPMPLMYESHGTRQFLKFYPIILQALETGGVAVFDELDIAIHPVILPEILRWFHDPKRNPYNAQLWMSCQNPSLLEDLIKEEVLFCEKDNKGRTEVYSLNDIKSVRRNENYYKKYLGGTYGAVPQIG